MTSSREESEKNSLVNKRERGTVEDDLQPLPKQMRESEDQEVKEEDSEENPNDFVLKRTDRFLCRSDSDTLRFYKKFSLAPVPLPVENNKPDDTATPPILLK